ncbi:Rne/Rng family ribonuclease [Marivivens donghaensis]|uniref:Rne/Rng family ribonuclease n=1 Tax=Marivivens donghaensis TaxID=1699413 RepID=UPI00201EF99B|nr:ribonuclease E/G [Marivivens donghaensis]MCL7408075.1 ribonuclease E/G [Marivivens donghaensis]MDN3703946.1 ribonuclease E/G [Marivivens donghaensis]
MAKKMLIDATHAEETRVVVVDGNKVEEFDFESQSKRQLAGNIYLAKVTRVEPSLQAAFVDYGGNRHGFLAFSEIHPDYYQIPVADREALIAEERAYAESLAAEDEDEDKPKKVNRRRRSRSKPAAAKSDDLIATKDVDAEPKGMETIDLGEDDDQEGLSPMETVAETPVEEPEDDTAAEAPVAEEAVAEDTQDEAHEEVSEETAEDEADDEDEDDADNNIESVANEDDHEDVRPARKPRPKRYKIQEVIKVRQILLIQVVKEERGNKGAALTTYLSLAGRYCVLMPNTARGGGISRKITNAVDRKKLKEIATEMDVPDGAGLIIRTAGSQRTKAEIKRDYEYLQRLWEQIRELTLQSTAPAKIYEEGDLIKRTIRDLYSKEIDEVIVAGDAGYRTAKDFMKMIMPSHSKNVKPYNDQLPLFARYQVEGYLAGMFNPTVQLPSGGYIVIGVTEALVAIDVNSGRATKEGSIEQTALKTNLEAADEVARQMRLRDLAGLIVIDFIDMDERKNNTAVEKRLKDKLKTDRARIQVGRISGFGLLEMSRQRLRPGMLEATTQPCPHCHGTGLLRSDDNVALSILRQLEEEGVRGRSKEVLVRAPIAIANYLMNQKREHIAAIEATYGMAVRIECDPTLVSPDFAIEKFKTATRIVPEAAPVVSASSVVIDDLEDDIEDAEILDEDEADADASDAETAEGEGDGDDKPKKRRRRRRRRKKPGQGEGEQSSESGDEAEGGDADAEGDAPEAEATEAAEPVAEVEAEAPVEAPKPKRTRTRRKPAAAAETAEGEATTTEAEAAEAPAEEAPKPKRTRTRKKPAAKAEEGEAVEAAPAEEAEEAPKPKRAPRARKKPAPKAEAVEAPAEVVAEPVAEATPEAPVEAAIEVAAPAPEPVAAPEPAPVAEPAPAPVAPAAEVEEPKDDKPKRRGWWSLGR